MGIEQFILAGFTAPIDNPTNPAAMLYLLPLSAAIALVYKATKLPKISSANFIKEVLILFTSIIFLMAIAGIALIFLAWLLLE